MFPDLVAAHASFTDNFLRAFYEAKRVKLNQPFGGPKSTVVNVLLQCPNCAAPNSNYKINCEYCNSPLKLFPLNPKP